MDLLFLMVGGLILAGAIFIAGYVVGRLDEQRVRPVEAIGDDWEER